MKIQTDSRLRGNDDHLPKNEVAVFGGGCFWCTEAVFSRLKGVAKVTSGYAGGQQSNPNYETVSSGNTGHAEVVKIEFDPTIIPYQTLLEIFWATHDPTTLNQQGADVGTQYRSIILYTTEAQKKEAETSRAEFQKTPGLNRKVVTEIQPLEKFYMAEEYHQKYFEQNQNAPYCQVVISPKITKLLEKYPELIRHS